MRTTTFAILLLGASLISLAPTRAAEPWGPAWPMLVGCAQEAEVRVSPNSAPQPIRTAPLELAGVDTDQYLGNEAGTIPLVGILYKFEDRPRNQRTMFTLLNRRAEFDLAHAIGVARAAGASQLLVGFEEGAMSPATSGCQYIWDCCSWDDYNDALKDFCKGHGGPKKLQVTGGGTASGKCSDGTPATIYCCCSKPKP